MSALQFSTSAASDGRRIELRAEGTVGHALVSGTEYKGDPDGGAATAWDTASLANGWQTLTSGTNSAAILKLDSQSTAIEGARLQSNTTWDSTKTHVVHNWVTVPSGVTLTISQGAIVKFCESAGIKVLSGGKVQINGAEGADVFFASIGNDTYGGDTNLRAGDFETNSYEIVTLNGGTWSDNGYWVTPDAQLRGYPEVTLHDSLASVSDGVARVPVTVEGTRNAPFSIDWQITGSPFSKTSGTLSWTQSSEGTKYIEIPLKSSYSPSGVETFTVRATLARSVTRANEAVQVKVFKSNLDLSALQFSTSAASAGHRLELREEGTVGHALVSGTEYKGDPNGGAATAWNTASLTTGWQTLTSGTNAAAILKLDSQSTAIEGGRLQSNTTWSNTKTHVVRNWVTVPNGVTLTITEGTIVKFCEMAGIKVLSGGKVQINGADGSDVFFASIGNDTYGGDTNLRAGDFATNSYEIITLNGGLWSDNGYWVTPDAAMRPYPEVELHDAIAAIESGVVRIPVSVSGTRNAPFSIDWQITGAPFSTTSGTLTWPQSSEGTKFIEIPLKANYSPNGTETFALSATRARSVNLSNETVRVSVYSGHIAVGDVIENGESTPSAGTEIETRGIGGTMIAKALENITYSPRWSGASECSIALDGNRLLSTADEDRTTWTRPETPGLYTFTHKAGGETLTARFAVLGDDTIAIDSNRLQSNTTWTADKTWLITGELTVKSGVTLTIEPGTVVKFMPGAKLIVEAGGTCIAKGVKFTHAYDDAVGGDTLFDGAVTLPVMEDYEIKGTVTDDDSTEYRYTAPIVLSGTITANTTWRGWKVYNVTGNLTIKSGVTLTIEPGTVVKFNSGVSLTVNSGATLNAIGTRAQQIVFTSIKDDEFGGDTNGDGEKTYPWAGDWARIYAGGTLNMNYCRIRYCNNNSDQGAIQGSGGTVTFDNGIIEASTYECVRMNSGKFTAHNSVFRDASMGFGYYGGSGVYVYNCVVADCTIACRASNKHFYNTVFYNCYTFLESTSSSCEHCVFYNEPGLGAQSATQVGSNGNIWGDPMFMDAEDGDFRLQKGSPCINAGDAANAPEFDYYGQPRDDGAPDIGIYELAGGMSANDLAAVRGPRSVAAATTIGDTLTVSYDVANVGKQAVSGSWRDKVSLVSADGGYSIDLGTVVQTAALAVGATNTFNASFTVPTDAEGTWRVQVGVNVERDIYEGANVTNNVATSEGTVEISLPARAASDGFSGTATKGAPASAKFALDGAEPMVARINAPAGTIVYFGSGFMPSASSYSARAVVGADGGLIGIPAGVTSAYILVETTSSKGVTFTMTLESAALAVQSVTPTTLPYTGTTGLVIDGANFAEGGRVALCRDQTTVIETAATVVSPTRMTAQIDCSRLTAGATYDVKVVGADGATATLPNAVAVANVPAAPKLKATLDAPASVRRGRTLTVYIDYENIGNADLPAPIFELISEGQVFKIDGACYTNSVKVMGLSSESPVGTLRPGEPQRLGIPVTILAENVKWKLRSCHAAQASAKTTRFSLRELYDEDWVLYHVSDDDTTIANLRTAIGSTFADYYTRLGAWLGTVEPQTKDYEVLKFAFGRYQYLKASGMLDTGEDVSPDSSTGGSPVQSMNAQAAHPTSAPHLMSEPTRGGDDVILGTEWKSKYPRDGSVWIWDSARENWILAVKEENGVYVPKVSFDSSKTTYIICHGNDNSIETPWLRQYALNLPSGSIVLAVNWGDGARCLFGLNPGTKYKYLAGSASHIPRTVDEAIKGLKTLGLDPEQTIMIGHSHGGHVAANIMTRWTGKAGTFKRLVGLDTSTQDHGVHGQNTMPPNWWMSRIRNCCKQTEFYRSSWELSLEEKNELWAEYNFALADKNTLYDFPTGFLSTTELGRHSFAHQWFLRTVQTPSAYPHIGFGFLGKSSWDQLCSNSGTGDILNPGPNKLLAGVIRMNRMELASFAKTDANKDGWRYAETILNDETKTKKSMYQLRNNSARTIEFEIQSITTTTEDSLVSGKPVTLTVKNNADNLSIPYVKPVSNDPTIWPWCNKLASGVWMVDLDGLCEDSATARGIEDWRAVSLDELKSMVGNRAYLVRLVSSMAFCAPNEDAIATPFILPTAANFVQLGTRFDNDVFGESRPLVSRDAETGAIKWRKVLLVAVAGVDSSTFGDGTVLPSTYKWDIYPKNNVAIKQISAIPANAIAVISTAASSRNSASLKSARLLSATSAHQLSANALKPGEAVQVKADKDGNWSIALDCTESYTTADEDEIVYNRFELTDAGSEGGAPRFQNGNTVCDVERVTVSGALPQTTDAEGNLVCEGKRYTVQLTVAAGDNEDDVTTCVIDVRATPDDDPGEDEDDDSSNEPKSCDPNAMEGDEGVGEKRLVKPGDTLTYTIYFENKSDADAAAACVDVVNPLNEWQDWSSLTMIDVGFNNHVDNGLNGKHEGESEKALEGTNTTVRTEFKVAYYDEEGNEVESDGEGAAATSAQAQWYLRIIDPNGDSEGWPLDMTGGFLPPNDDTHCGEGYIKYSIRVRDDAPAYVVITNSATIIFDHFNDPIETDPAWWNTVGADGACFTSDDVAVEEGGVAVVRVYGGSMDAESSVKVHLTYQTASAADVDLKAARVSDGGGAVATQNLKFPITLKWAAGEIGIREIAIPVNADALYEGDEAFTLQLAGASGMELGEPRLCTVTIAGDGGEPPVPEGAVVFDGGYYTVNKKKGTATATAFPGYVFSGWILPNGKVHSTKATIDEKTRKSKNATPRFDKAAYLRVLSDDPATGTVGGQGLYAAGKEVTLKATLKKGYALTGWRTLDGELVSQATSPKVTVGAGMDTYVATFKKEGELSRPVQTLADEGGETSSQEASGNDRTISVGVSYPATLSVSGEAAVKISKVAGLPTGLSYKGGKISGVPTKAGKFTASVTVALSTNAKKTWTCKVPFTVVSLPEWAVGTFTGNVKLKMENGELEPDELNAPATMSVGSTGKVSGKFALGGTNWTFSASSYAKDSVVTGEVVRFTAAMTAKGTWKEKSGKKTVTKTATEPIGFALVADPATSEIASVTENGYFGEPGEGAGTVEFVRDAGVSVTKDGEASGGTVTLSTALGQAAAGATVKATAKLNKGYAFTGWRRVEGGEASLVSQSLAYSFAMTGVDVFLTASFKKESDLVRPTLTWNGDVHPDVADTNLTMGVAYAADLAVSGEAAVKISKVAGLPAGLSYKDGKIGGVPTKSGNFTVTVTVALSTNAKKTWTYKAALAVSALPDYAKGSFTGVASGGASSGLVLISVGSTGKISGKFQEGGTNWTLSAKSYTSRVANDPASDEFVCTNLAATFTWKEKSGKRTVTKTATRGFALAVGEGMSGEAVLGYAEAAEDGGKTALEAWQNRWGTDYKAVGAALFWTSAKKPFRTWESVEADGRGEYDTISLKVASSGDVTATYRFFTGAFDSKGRPKYATYVCTTAMIPTSPADPESFAGYVPVCLPPDEAAQFPGFCAEMAYPFTECDVPVPAPQ